MDGNYSHLVQKVHFVQRSTERPSKFGVYKGRREPGAQSSVSNDMKQYLVVKIAKRLGALAMEAIPVAGLFPLEAAEKFVRDATADEPGSLFLIQQVGNA
jgi:hypothetical protein